MEKIIPINLNNGVIHIHPYRKIDEQNGDVVEDDLFEILSDVENMSFMPERYITSRGDVSKLMLGVTVGYATNSRWSHFLSLVKFHNKVVGQIDIISPQAVFKSYGISEIWLIEYFLHKMLWSKGIMTDALSAIINNLRGQGINNIGAICKTDNLSSLSVLNKLGFIKDRIIDAKQDLYILAK